VKYGINRYSRFCVLEKYGVRKFSYQSPAVRLVNDGVDHWLAADTLDTGIDRTEELLAEPRSATLIPDIGIDNIEFRFWRKDQSS
jgi:hypothetical protein